MEHNESAPEAHGTRSWVARHRTITAVVAVVALLTAVGALGKMVDSRAAIAANTSPADPTRSAPPPTPAASTPAASTPSTTAPPANRAAAHTALALLATLAVKGRAPMTGYDRAAFGAAWTDTNRNGCDTRNDVLRRDLADREVKAGTNNCVSLGGWLEPDPYSGLPIHFVYGGASEVDIDHVVALGDAWQTGAFRWVPLKRLALANDPMNLLAVSASANRSKGDADAATWLPSNTAYRCAYVARQVAVKVKYGLWVTAAEGAASERILDRCPALLAPTGTAPTISPVAGTAAAPATSRSAAANPAYGDATAVCNDGTLSHSAHHSGTCSGHGGVRQWLT